MKEEWKPFPDEDFCHYWVSNMGKIKNSITGRILKAGLDSHGYPMVILYKDGQKKPIKIHRAVMLTFCPILNSSEMEVNHINAVKTDNMIKNLEWCTRAENLEHARKNHLFSGSRRRNPIIPRKQREWKVGDIVSWQA